MLNSVSILIQVCERASRVSQLPTQIYITTILRKISIFLILQAGISICIAMSLHNLFLR